MWYLSIMENETENILKQELRNAELINRVVWEDKMIKFNKQFRMGEVEE